MNKIEIKNSSLPYLKNEVLCAYIDGIRTDLLVSSITNESFVEGYVPAWHYNLFSLEDFEAIWNASVSRNDVILPILICPEERDLSFRPIVTELITKGDTVIWNKFGELRQHHDRNEVDWLSNIVHKFKLGNFHEILKIFKQRIDLGDDEMMKNILRDISGPLH